MENSSRGWNPIIATKGVAYKFNKYLESKQYSKYSIYRTLGYVHTQVVQNIIYDITGERDIYNVDNVEKLHTIIRQIIKTEQDMKSHHMYSSAVRRYLNFIENGI